jgi:peptide/nickel transport system substrate-binding protein
LAGQLSHVTRTFAFLSLLTVVACGGPSQTAAPAARSPSADRGGELVASFRSDPASFNRLMARDTSTNLVSLLTQARLVRINQATQEVEPQLAESWTASDDGRRVTMALRRGVQFSDGHPFTSADVLFTFAALYDPKVGSILADSLQAVGRNLDVTAPDDHTVVIGFPVAFGPGIRILDVLPILPRHKLEASLAAGAFGKAWGVTTPLADLAGLGPFVLSEYQPGQRLVFARNPRYFGKAPDGTQLPYLDRLVVEVVPDQSAELLRLESGQLDMMTSEISPDAYAPLKRAADEGRVKLLDVGVARNADGLWFNLKPGAFAGDPRAPWIQRDELRKAIALAVDRKAFADTVFLGAAVPIYGPETPANKVWFWSGTPATPHDPAAARQLLASIGLTDRNGDGMLEDAAGRPARFALLTQKGRPNLERGAAVVREAMQKIGVAVDVVTLDSSALIDAFYVRRQFDAVYFNATRTDSDPGTSPDFWFSSGTAHPWNHSQKEPATAWERQIDDLMSRQIASRDMTERKRLYDEVQKIFVEHLPIVYFAAPRIYVAHSSRVVNLLPSESRPQLLWRPEMVAVVH